MNKKITAVIKSVAKIYTGELVEESKLIQIEELEASGVDCSGDVQIGPIEPRHLAEARKRLIAKAVLVPEKPKPLFLRR